MATSRRAALYVRVSTSDRGQTVENQLQPLQDAARRLGWTVVAIPTATRHQWHQGRDKQPDHDDTASGLDDASRINVRFRENPCLVPISS